MATALYDTGVYGTDVYGEITEGPPATINMLLLRESPPLRTHVTAVSPSGRHYRWGHDEPNAANVPNGERFSDTMPGGFESLDVTLPRKSGTDYSDLTSLSTLQIRGASGDIAGEYRLERSPSTSGDQMAISPSAVGKQAHLEDNKSAKEIYVHADMSAWKGVSVQRKSNNAGTFKFYDSNAEPDATTGQPAIATTYTGPWGTTDLPVAEAWFDSNNIPLHRLAVSWKKNANVDGGAGDPFFGWYITLYTDDVGTAGNISGDLQGVGPGIGATVDATVNNRVFARLSHQYETGPIAGNNEYTVWWTVANVYGRHGLPVYGTFTATSGQGVLASDVVRHAVGRWAPSLKVTTESIQPSGFVIPHLAFLEPTTAGEIVRQATRFGLQDWAVWDGGVFWFHNRGARGRKWRARAGSSQLEATGPQVDRIWESILVSYNDVDGTTKSVGPPGSGANTETTLLKDADPDNPATQAGIIRRDVLQMGVSTPAGAIEIGRRFLEESKLLDSSGRARIVGYVEDDRGILHPYWKIRSGDQIAFVDAADTSYRRIVKTEKTVSDRSCSVDLDAPPEGLQALLERLGVVLTPLGI